MKKVLLLVALLALIASPSFAGISGSLHDFSTQGWTTDGRICVACHTPHGGTTGIEAPLWNHTVTNQDYQQYDSATIDLYAPSGAVDFAPTGISALCLSCHDGAVALNAFTGGAADVFLTGTAAIGSVAETGGMLNDHPVSFTYPANASTVDAGLYNNTVASGLGGTISEDMLFGASNDQLECASCHDVHRSNETAAFAPMLVKPNTASGLCLTCHNK